MRFIHISDVHLGVTPDAGRPWSKKRERDIWKSFAEVIAAAAELSPDFLFITGDLFHAQPLKKELREVNHLFEQIPDTRIILLAGNHDYLRQKSYYLTYQWSKNVYFFSREESECFDFPELNTAIYGLSYWHREILEPLYDDLVPDRKDRVNVLLAHGGDARHIPFSAAKIMQNGFDYLAAGHIHKGRQLIPGQAVMAGSLEPTDCNDTGPHGYWIGNISKEKSELQFCPIKKCEYCHETYAVDAKTTDAEIYEWAEKLLRERPTYQYFRLFLEGVKAPETEYDTAGLEELMRIVDVTEKLLPDYDYEKLSLEYEGSLLESYIQTMMNRPKDIVTKKALEYGVDALLGYKICR